MDLLSDLDPDQQAAVSALGPMTLILAGAGAGKTRVLTFGLAELIAEHGFDERQLLLLTFTRQAASSMVARAREVADLPLDALTAGTFHSVGLTLLADIAGRRFTVLDEEESVELLSSLSLELMRDRDEEDLGAPDPGRCLAMFARAREEGRALSDDDSRTATFSRELFDRYEQAKRELAALDYTDILVETLRLLESDAGARFAGGLRAVLVDEAQDLSALQWRIVERLCAHGAWMIVVADPQQSIYAFRGAQPGQVEQLAARSAVVRLERNYRSTPEIVELANEIARGAPLALELRATSPSGARPALLACGSETEEGAGTLQWVQAHLEAGAEPEELAVLARAHSHFQAVDRLLREAGIPVCLLDRRRGPLQQFRRGLMALMRLAAEPKSDQTWRRVLRLLCGEEDSPEDRELPAVLAGSDDPFAAFAAWCEDERLRRLIGMLDGAQPGEWLWRDLCYGPYGQLVHDSGAGVDLAERLAESSPEGEGERFLSELALGYEEPIGDGVRLGTVHAAKGLEWPHVLILRVAPGSFPLSRADQEEERRLFYVAATRPERSLTVCQSSWITGDGDGFLSERIRACFG